MLKLDLSSRRLWLQVGTVFLLVTLFAVDIRHYIEDSSTPQLTSSNPEPTSSTPEPQPEPKLTWTRKAAFEAETVAAIYCSDHGRAYVDGNITENGVQVCECHNCYSGDACQDYDDKCVADATVGDALFLRKYWMQEKENIATLVSGWHRMSYFIGKNFMSDELVRNIKLLHEKVGNAKVEGKHIVFGHGITQLLNGLIISLSPNLTAEPAAKPKMVVARAPYYPVFKSQTNFFNHKGYEWKGDASKFVDAPNGKDFIELVTSPNNPDGYLHKEPVIKNSIAIYDHATYWPHYAPIQYESNEDIMLFTLSKYTGHAGSRFGWAILESESLYDKLATYIATNTEGVSRETQFRTLKIIKDILVQKELHHDFNEFGYSELRSRWVEITELVKLSNRFSVQQMGPERCNYFNRIREPATAYAWLKCNWEDEKNCSAVLETGKIKAYSGENFEASSIYARVSLVKTEDDFKQLMGRLTDVVKQKKEDRDISLYNSIVKQQRSSGRPFILDADH